ncbi:helix-turn-helix transcriptional regulator [Streptomyces sp. NPDC001665]
MESWLDTERSGKHAFHVRNEVRELRLARGLSQAQLGAVVGVSRQTINSIEAERYTPSLPLALSLSRFFQCAVEEMFHVDGDTTHG